MSYAHMSCVRENRWRLDEDAQHRDQGAHAQLLHNNSNELHGTGRYSAVEQLSSSSR
jgi:hypothetical protein